MSRPTKLLIVNFCTLTNLVGGLGVIYLVSQGFFRLGASLLLIGVVFDSLDGFLARRWGVASEFGGQLDSFADMVSFVVATGFLGVSWQLLNGADKTMAMISWGLYCCCGALRLARYNIDSDCSPDWFSGLPTTAMSLMIGSLFLASSGINWELICLFMTLGSLLMVSPFPYCKWTQLVKNPWVMGLSLILFIIDVKLWVWLGTMGFLLSGPILWLIKGSKK